MIISFCIPCMNRTYDLKKIMSSLIETANVSPPVEILVLDYNSQDDLAEYIESVRKENKLLPENKLTYLKYTGRDYYHMAHARNLATLAASGEWIIPFATDIVPHKEFIQRLRMIIDKDKPGIVYGGVGLVGVSVCRKDEFIAAGGYDERFEFYGPEDKELLGRLIRRGNRLVGYDPRLLEVMHTIARERRRNYRVQYSKRESHHLMFPILEQSREEKVLVANKDVQWGQW